MMNFNAIFMITNSIVTDLKKWILVMTAIAQTYAFFTMQFIGVLWEM